MDVSPLLRLARPIVDFALPPRCPACGAIQAENGLFCPDCWARLRFLTRPWCAGCGLPFAIAPEGILPGDAGDAMLCGACLAAPPVHDGVRAAVAYGAVARDIALKLKYGGKIGLARLIAGHLRRFVAEEGMAAEQLVVPVPLHWTRLWQRGFNQAALIGDALARGYRGGGEGGTPLCPVPDLLQRIRRTPPLRHASPARRMAAMAGAFSINPRHAARVKGAHILLIDDVYTTGATSHACARVLKQGGAAHVRILCWSRVLPDGAAEEVAPLFQAG